jgi:hypothetical protein
VGLDKESPLANECALDTVQMGIVMLMAGGRRIAIFKKM